MPALLLFMPTFQTASGASLYTQRPDDPKAVADQASGDGETDDTDAIQEAIDRVEGQGIVLLPEGRYRITRTLVVPPGVRVFGFGAHRPCLVLAPNTPGWQETERIMVFFSGRRGMGIPEVPASAGREGADFDLPEDANPGTFYSAMANVDLEVGEGNPATVGVRGRYAQHCYLAHMDFRLCSGLAAIHDTGNEAHDLRFFGGEYGIVTRTPSPGWPFLLMDSHFEGQSKAAILTRTAGLTLVRPTFRHVPTAVEADVDHSEQLWMQDARLEDVSGPAIIVSRENSLRTQIAVENATCLRVPTFLRFRESGKTLPSPLRGRGVGGEGSEFYVVHDLSHGLRYPSLGAEPEVETRLDAVHLPALPPPPPTDVTPLPPVAEWADLRALGAKGDGVADDTAVLKKAIAEHRTVYLPQGHYRVTDTILLRPDTVLVGLNPITTQIVLPDATPGYEGEGAPKPLLETPRGGTNLVSGIGLDSGGDNPAAVAALWRAGEGSTMEDVKFVGGHESGVPVYDADHTMDPDPSRRWDSQHPSLWVADGGGGTFRNLWTASTFAAAGMLVSETETPGRVYGMSSEHHVRHEIRVRNAAHWRFVALQTEEERGESSACLPIEVERSRDILFANLNMYRVVSVVQPFPCAIRTTDSEVRLRNVHGYSNSKASFDNLLIADGHELRQREFAALDVSSSPSDSSGRGGHGERPLPHIVVQGQPQGHAYLDDVAALADGLFRLADLTGDERWRTEARRLGETMIADFEDPATGAYLSTSAAHEELFGRTGSMFDAPIPSGNALALRVLVAMGETARVERLVAAVLGTMERAPTATEGLYAAAIPLVRPLEPLPLGRGRGGVPANEATVRLAQREIRADSEGRATLAVVLELPDGLHVNGPNPPDPWLTPTKVTVRPLQAEVAYPTGEYVGIIEIPLTVVLQRGESGADLEIAVAFQPCTERECLAPVERTLSAVVYR